MYEAKSIYVKLAWETIKNYVANIKEEKIDKSEELKVKRSCFVTLHKKNGELRGCIGTILPVREDLYEEIRGNAISACSRDPRFMAVTEDELENLTVSVDVLTEPEIVKNIEELNPKIYGIILVDQFGRQGVLLPDLDGVDTIDEQISIVKQKAGMPFGTKIEDLTIYKFEAKRFF
ncbi:AmmeMemoRadiSam system protein A [Haliovirga abyssi]|uniref:AMMECR1 domain-containing protein n=1 Tax=Haliovirga abyssi TaxID=2996794 RepID=A0AAU9DCA8_9FUSO|nr:AmmeMemoRadiSam system protein A [Haliovirga abyssi]BDU50935.1 hypothetical protein HLVA_15040 [Haliovirga abyssi]